MHRNLWFIGSVVALAVIISVLGSQTTAQVERNKKAQVGRYQLEVVVKPNFNPLVVVLDTATGRTWTRSVSEGHREWKDVGSPAIAK